MCTLNHETTWLYAQAAKVDVFERALACAADVASDAVRNDGKLPKWAWRAIPGIMGRIGSWVHPDLVTAKRMTTLLAEQVRVHAAVQVNKKEKLTLGVGGRWRKDAALGSRGN
jgi:hypothetical protein